MGCFLQCFGLSKKRKRRKTPYKLLAAADQKHGNYEALDCYVTVNRAIKENPINPVSDIRDEFKEKTGGKSRKKKVTFNLNVQIYEPNPTAYQILDSGEEEDENEESNGDESATSAIQYPSNHRYYNCKDDYDEEDVESDISYDDDEFDEDDDWDDEIEVDDENTRKKEISDNFCSPEAEESKWIPLTSNDNELKPIGTSLSGQYMLSVLHPVENLTQWKAIKAKVAATSKHRRKENVPLLPEPDLKLSPFGLEPVQSRPLLPEIAVDASLSNWLISSNSYGSATAIHCQ
ncbi:hypothetical protein L6164_025954 [Bauhinia variegata]|uniref:Uncharacterized protein n=1 Tax=Bauhinia variegata TaxID=167791 RepID=A0ACB9M346_BAUVA|nr:hypothetical protein L6164_025954 [Bauhinia variegata]